MTPQGGALPHGKGVLFEETPAGLHDLLAAFVTPATGGAASDDDDDTPRGDAQNVEFGGWSSPEEVSGHARSGGWGVACAMGADLLRTRRRTTRLKRRTPCRWTRWLKATRRGDAPGRAA